MRSRSGSRSSTDAVRRALDVALADLAPQVDEVVLLLALLDDEEDVDGVERADRLRGHVLGIARADADQRGASSPDGWRRAIDGARDIARPSASRGAAAGGRRSPGGRARARRRAWPRSGCPPLSFVTTRSMPWRSIRPSSPSSVYGPAVEQQLVGGREAAARAGRCSARGTTRRARPRSREALPPRGQERRGVPRPAIARRGRGRVVDPVPVVALPLAPARAARGAAAARRRCRRRCAAELRDALGERVAWRRRRPRCGPRRASARAPRARRSRRRAPRPPAAAGARPAPPSDEITGTPSRDERGGELARLAGAAEHEHARLPSRRGRALARRRVEVALAKAARGERTADDHDRRPAARRPRARRLRSSPSVPVRTARRASSRAPRRPPGSRRRSAA